MQQSKPRRLESYTKHTITPSLQLSKQSLQLQILELPHNENLRNCHTNSQTHPAGDYKFLGYPWHRENSSDPANIQGLPVLVAA